MRNIRIVDAGLGSKIYGWKVKECIKYVTRLLLLFWIRGCFLKLNCGYLDGNIDDFSV
jgi:hypothetical protein